MNATYVKILAGGLFAAVATLTLASAAQAQGALCPTSINVQGGDRSGFVLENGACTNRTNAGAFSGAALATQALSELNQTTTQESNRNTVNAIADRRETEAQRCPAGLTRINGVCQRPAAAAPVTPRPRVAAPNRPAAAAEPRRRDSRVVARREPPPRARMTKSEPPAPPVLPFLPVPEGPRFAAWGTGYGDYERREGRGTGNIQCCFAPGGAPGGLPNQLLLDVRSNATTAGFLGGLDVTGRNILNAGDGVITGVLTGYVSTELTVNTRSTPTTATVVPGFAHLHANLSGPSVGFFATYFNGPFSADLTYRADLLGLSERFTDVLGFTAQPTAGAVQQTFIGGGRTGLTTHSVMGNLNYRVPLGTTFWVEPTVGVQYTATNYDAGAARLGLDNGDLFRVQGGLRFGSTFATADQVLVTASLSGLAYDDVLVRGGFLEGAGFIASNILARSDEGKIRGLGILALNFDYGNGFSWFVQGSVRGGENLFGAGGKGGFRYQW